MQTTSVFSDLYHLPNKLALMGLRPGVCRTLADTQDWRLELFSDVPTGLIDRPDFGDLEVLTQTLWASLAGAQDGTA